MPRFLVLLILSLATAAYAADRKPNIILIYADDLGWGDVGAYGATKVKTPGIDKLAAEGLRFTDAHCTSGTCTPSRYSLLTGQYAFRKKGAHILPGDAALIIDPARPTVPNVLKSAGYATAVIGKWHLGLGSGDLDWNSEIKPGPIELGFGKSFIIPATVDRVPCVFVEDHRVYKLDSSNPIQVSYKQKVGDEPTGKQNPDLLKMKLTHGHDATIVNGISRIGWMTGGKAARWVDEDIADVITTRGIAFIEQNKDKPFFLYLATHDIHVPRTPHARFAGKSETGTRGDVIAEFDWTVGQIAAAVDRLGLAQNTLIMVSSDNGPVLDDGYVDGAVEKLNGHKPAGPWRGGKYSAFEGGTRVPLVARWPGKIKPAVSDALVCQVDFLRSFATLAGATVPQDGAEDSQDLLPALLGDSPKGREFLIEQGGGLALRMNHWKLIPAGEPAGAGGGKVNADRLFNLTDDPGEQKDVAGENPEIAKKMKAEFSRLTGK